MSEEKAQTTTSEACETVIATLDFWNVTKGYGKATSVDDPTKQYFVHHANVERAEDSGQYLFLWPGM
jgi:hypothetical protein